MLIDQSLVMEQLKTVVTSAIFDTLGKEQLTVSQPKEWLTEKEARAYLDVSKTTMQKYRNEGQLAFSQYGKKIYYRYKDINDFIAKNYSS